MILIPATMQMPERSANILLMVAMLHLQQNGASFFLLNSALQNFLFICFMHFCLIAKTRATQTKKKGKLLNL